MLVDDHPLLREGAAAALGVHTDLQVVAEAGDAAEARGRFAEHRPDVVLLDVRLPEGRRGPGAGGGIGLLGDLRRAHGRVRALMLSGYGAEADVVAALEAGASGYLLKDEARQNVAAAVREVAAGRQWFSQAVAGMLARRSATPSLTPRELEVLRLTAEGLPNKAIAGRIHVSGATVKAHLSSVFGKLDVASRTEAVAAAVRRGIVSLDRWRS